MLKYNRSFLTMEGGLGDYFQINKDKIKDNPILLEGINEMQLLAVTIVRFDEIASRDTSGIAKKKRKIKKDLAYATFLVSGPIRTYAFDTGNYHLYNLVRTSRSEMQWQADMKTINDASTVLEIGTEKLEELKPYGSTQEKLDKLAALLESFKEINPKPREAIANKATAQRNMVEKFAELRELVTGKLDNAMLEYATTDKLFYDGYVQIRVIVDAGTLHYSLWGYASDEETGKALQYVSLKLFLDGKPVYQNVRFTSKTGFYAFKGLDPATYTLKISFENYDPLEQIIYLHPGQSKRFDFALRKTE